jgi:hypothetical protein
MPKQVLNVIDYLGPIAGKLRVKFHNLHNIFSRRHLCFGPVYSERHNHPSLPDHQERR